MCKDVEHLISSKIEQSRNTFGTFDSAQILPNYRVLKNKKVYKHNNLINCKSNFSAIEHRIIVLAISQVTAKDENLKMYRINIQDVLGKNHRSHYNIVRDAIDRLHQSTIKMEEGKKWKSYAFITKAQGESGINFIEIQFHEEIQKFLLGLKSHYTCYTLDNVMNFKKNYSLRIYELCKQYQKIGSRVMKMDYLKTILSLDKKSAYNNFAQFKRRVLNPALEEINKYSDIEVSFVERKEGRSVHSIHFFIERKQGISLQKSRTLEELFVYGDNNKILESLGFNDEEMDLMRQQNMETKISAVLVLYEKHIDEVKFPKPWIEKALKENFVDSSVYKRQLAVKKSRLDLMWEKDKQIQTKQIEIRGIRKTMADLEDDISFYKLEGKLRPGDVMRFEKDCTIEEAIEILQIRLKDAKYPIAELEKEISILDAEANALK